MFDIIRIVAVFALILILLRKKWSVGYSLMAGSVFLMVIYLMRPGAIVSAVQATISSGITLKLLVALAFIRMFEIIMRERNVIRQMMDSFKGMLRHKKTVIVSMPLLIGMLPSVGGAYFSAPMVDEATREVDMRPEDKAFTNYWYRHPWEYILPLYPGIILASVLTDVDVRTFIILNMAYAICMVVSGNFFGLQKAKGAFVRSEEMSRKGLLSFIPIIILLALVMVFDIELHVSLMAMTVLLFIFYRYGFKDIIRIVKYGISKDVVLLIMGVMLFKEVLEHSGAVRNLSDYFTVMSIPIVPLVFILPFTTGVLTGITVGAVGSTFPLIVTMAGNDPHLLSLAFAAGFVGVLLSPGHVCLILTREYFKADMWLIYKKLIPATIILSVVAIIEYLIVN
ncbi:MAG: DUF401 family protein [Nitrospirota bacterium]|nr:MAG: DUF401 family protein [Nitrospirota bacterium]